ncbi:MAG: response regulator [Ignavibacteria bacterium]|nr:response regulator [Ignavibacteria bacterium]
MFKIVIIDDDPDIVEATTMLFESKGYLTATAGNVEDALDLVPKEKPDVIILDVMMEEPDDGFYLAAKFRKMGINTPIIMLTSVSKAFGFDFGDKENLQIQEFLEKPVPPTVLLENVLKYLPKEGH